MKRWKMIDYIGQMKDDLDYIWQMMDDGHDEGVDQIWSEWGNRFADSDC